MASSSASLEGFDTTKEIDQLNLPSFTRMLLVADPVGGGQVGNLTDCRLLQERRGAPAAVETPQPLPDQSQQRSDLLLLPFFFSPSSF